MSIFSRIKTFVRRSPSEQIVGYSRLELNSVFTETLSPITWTLSDYPQVVSLEGIGVPAYYSTFLITDYDVVD